MTGPTKSLQPMITRLQLGDVEVFSFVENECHFDGGGMFGIIPKKLWSKHFPADKDNLIRLHNNVLLIKKDKYKIIVDCGLGDTITERERKMYGCFTSSLIEPSLERIGVAPEDVNFVIPTHLHLDHIGGAFRRDESGEVMPQYPNARHIINRTEWETAMAPDPRSRAAYPSERIHALEHAGLVDFFEVDTEFMPGLWIVRTGGHTKGHCSVILETSAGTLFFAADLIPTSAHIKPEYILGADLYPLETMEHKKKALTQIQDGDWILAFDHDPDYKFARLKPDGNNLVAEKAGEPFLAAMTTCRDNMNVSKR